jgi:hypothetical protein
LSLKVCFQTFKDKKPFKDSKIMANKPKTYVGINNEINGGMTSIGKVIRDGWVFGLLDESETCEGWNLANTSPLFINFYSSSSLVSCSPDQPAFLAFWMATS